MVEVKYLCFPIFCIFTIPSSYINIGFKNIPPVKSTQMLYFWVLFQKNNCEKSDWPTQIFTIST